MQPPERERDHRTGPVRVNFRVSFVTVMMTVKIVEGIEFCLGFLETAQFSERENDVSEVSEVIVWGI